MKLVCSTTENYLDNMRNCLITLNGFSSAQNVLITVDFDPPLEYFEKIPRISWKRISHEQNAGAAETSHSIQHGSFVPLVSEDDDDLILYIDGDVIMQRPFSNAEMIFLDRVGPDIACVGWNSGPHEKLVHEAMRLGPRGDHRQTSDEWGEMIETEPCFNIGVMAARAGTWRKLHARYLELYDKALNWFRHPARQQWLMCYAMAELGIGRHVLPYSFHSHAHYGLPPNVYLAAGGLACHEDRVILFRHRF